MNFLVVDDSSTMRRIVANVIQQIGIPPEKIVQASDGVQALRELDDNDMMFDIVLTDWNMPNMTGLELVNKIRTAPETKYYRKIPIIMITTEGGKNEVITALKSGVNNYIVKPFNAEVLKEKIKPFFK